MARWQKLERAYLENDQLAALSNAHKNPPHSIWRNNIYQIYVWVEPRFHPSWPCYVHLSIKRNDKEPIHDWRDLQRIKNEICGTGCDAIELYPAEDRLVDEANQYHLYVFFPGVRIPIGDFNRKVDTPENAHKVGASQRPFDKHHNSEDCKQDGLIDWEKIDQ